MAQKEQKSIRVNIEHDTFKKYPNFNRAYTAFRKLHSTHKCSTSEFFAAIVETLLESEQWRNTDTIELSDLILKRKTIADNEK